MLRGPDVRSERFLNDLDIINNRIDKAQRQISSGKKITTVSDSPDQVSDLLAARSELGHMTQLHNNLNLVKTEVDTAEGTLAQAINALDRALTLGTQGASNVNDANSRNTLALEVDGILEQIVSMSAVSVNGRYIFSGDGDQVPPYSLDLTQNPPVSTYQGSPSTRLVQHPQGLTIPIAKTADEIFDNVDPAKNVFGALNALRGALRLNDTNAIESAVANLRGASEHLNGQEAFYGSVQNRVSEGLDFASKQELSFKERISNLEDADVSQAILELTQGKVQQEAALSAQAQQPKTSLFDFLR
jgi:flagellar hook-associated protein 3 FlgL